MHAQTPSPSCFLWLPNSSITLMGKLRVFILESTAWPTVDFQVTLKEQVLISTALTGRGLKFCLLVSYCHWFNLCWADVHCCTLIRPGISVIPARGPIQTASSLHLPKSLSFLWEEAQVNCGIMDQHDLFAAWAGGKVHLWSGKQGEQQGAHDPQAGLCSSAVYSGYTRTPVICWKACCRVTLWKVLGPGAWPQPVFLAFQISSKHVST